MSPEITKKARAVLAGRQSEYRAARAERAAKARAELDGADELADRVLRVRLDALGGAIANGDAETMAEAIAQSRALQDELAAMLEARGFERDILFDAPMCRACGDAGYVGPRVCQCLKDCVDEVSRAVPAGLEGGSFSRFDLNVFSDAQEGEWTLSQRENMEGHFHFCRTWAARFGADSENLFLNGGTGQGKTFLCGCMAETVAAAGRSVCYTTAVRMFERFESLRFDHPESGGEGVDTSVFFNADLLIVDDLGTEMVTAYVQSVLYDLINTRLTRGVKTVINANLSAEQLEKRYLPQTCSRLLGVYRMLHFFGPDLRMVKHTSKFGV